MHDRVSAPNWQQQSPGQQCSHKKAKQLPSHYGNPIRVRWSGYKKTLKCRNSSKSTLPPQIKDCCLPDFSVYIRGGEESHVHCFQVTSIPQKIGDLGSWSTCNWKPESGELSVWYQSNIWTTFSKWKLCFHISYWLLFSWIQQETALPEEGVLKVVVSGSPSPPLLVAVMSTV